MPVIDLVRDHQEKNKAPTKGSQDPWLKFLASTKKVVDAVDLMSGKFDKKSVATDIEILRRVRSETVNTKAVLKRSTQAFKRAMPTKEKAWDDLLLTTDRAVNSIAISSGKIGNGKSGGLKIRLPTKFSKLGLLSNVAINILQNIAPELYLLGALKVANMIGKAAKPKEEKKAPVTATPEDSGQKIADAIQKSDVFKNVKPNEKDYAKETSDFYKKSMDKSTDITTNVMTGARQDMVEGGGIKTAVDEAGDTAKDNFNENALDHIMPAVSKFLGNAVSAVVDLIHNAFNEAMGGLMTMLRGKDSVKTAAADNSSGDESAGLNMSKAPRPGQAGAPSVPISTPNNVQGAPLAGQPGAPSVPISGPTEPAKPISSSTGSASTAATPKPPISAPAPVKAPTVATDDSAGGEIKGVINEKGKQFKNTGSMVVNGNTYNFVTGGAGRGSAPLTSYDVDPKMMQGGSLGNRWVLTEKGKAHDTAYDPQIGATRQNLRIHASAGRGTLGCIGIIGGEKVYQDFQKDLITVMNKNGGKVSFKLGTAEAQNIVSNMSAPPPGQAGKPPSLTGMGTSTPQSTDQKPFPADLPKVASPPTAPENKPKATSAPPATPDVQPTDATDTPPSAQSESQGGSDGGSSGGDGGGKQAAGNDNTNLASNDEPIDSLSMDQDGLGFASIQA